MIQTMTEYDPRSYHFDNPFRMIGEQWMLVTAGNERGYNTMTASWGGLGVLWNKNVATIYIRPQRYTKEFIDANEQFTLSFFSSKYRPALSLCGSKSGREVDKAKETGLTPIHSDGVTYFAEAEIVLLCKKLYRQSMDPSCFLDSSLIDANYPQNDFHEIYIAEITKILVKEK